jgi:SAM-dependent methyltransferase
MSSDSSAYFDALYRASDDPYELRARWYETRKRALLLAALPQRHYHRIYEPGCGSGELTAELAPRCDHLLASDRSEFAVEIAIERAAGLRNVRVERQTLPADWPFAAGPFDLIVLSEIGYFLEQQDMNSVAQACRHSLSDEGTLVACDWRADFTERVLPTDSVHAALAALGLPLIVRHEEEDFLLQVWAANGRSVARREGIC